MFMNWSTISFTIVVLIIVISVFFRVKFSRQVFISGVLSLVVFQILFLLQGATAAPETGAPIEQKILEVAGIILAFNTIVQMIKWLVIEFANKRRHFNIPPFLLDIVGWTAIIIVLFLVINNIFGVELTGLFVTSTVATMAVGLALQNALSNLISGIVLQIESPFTIGDWVEVAGQEAQVVKQNWRTLAVLTRHNHNILITNNDVAQEKIVNFSRPTPLQAQDASIEVADEYPPSEVKKILKKAVIGIQGVLPEPEPIVFVISYGDTAIGYRIRYWINDFVHREIIEDAVLTNFWYALKRADMTVPTPARDITVKMLSDKQEKQELAKQQNYISDIVRSLPLFEGLTEKQLQRLVAAAENQTYTISEKIIHQEDEEDALFIIKSGQVGIYSRKDGQNILVSTLQENDFFGEMNLLKEQPHSVSVIAHIDTDIITIRKDAFIDILMIDFTILELVLTTLDERREKILGELC